MDVCNGQFFSDLEASTFLPLTCSCLYVCILTNARKLANPVTQSLTLSHTYTLGLPFGRLLLLRNGARASLADHEGRLPLHWATDNASPDCLTLLLDDVPGQTVNATDAAGMTPLMWAAFHNKVRFDRFIDR